MSRTEPPIVQVRGLTKHFPIKRGFFGSVVGHVHAVDDVSFDVPAGRTVALVGESGCGKTTTGRTILRLLEPTAGRVIVAGEDITHRPDRELLALRRRMQVIFQDPYSSLNPRMTVEDIVGEGLRVHSDLAAPERQARVAELLRLVGLAPTAARRYPHEFSGGQRQRIGIARALSTNPDFVVCDEAVSALDVSIQAQIINLLEELQQRLGLAYLFIAHDLAVVRHIADAVVVMYLGHVMEEADADALFAEPLHPYTQALLSAIPVPAPGARQRRQILGGEIPSPVRPPAGCRFHTRCPQVMEKCRQGEIPVFEPHPGRRVKCLLYDQSPVAHKRQELPPEAAGAAVTGDGDQAGGEEPPPPTPPAPDTEEAPPPPRH
jgi:oligopeptide/dipeptide ABC transporter ATP-binding protein